MLQICERCGSPTTAGACAHCGGPLSSSKLGASAILLGLGLAVGASGCIGGITGEADYGSPDTGYLDADGDGQGVAEDCDDSDPERYSGAEETPGDGVDSNCDGEDDT